MLNLDMYSTLVSATLVLLIGKTLIKSSKFLNKYSIPEPVVGGIIAAVIIFVLNHIFDVKVSFDLSLQEPMMLAFFATIGLSANLSSLRAGGKILGIFLFVVTGLLIIQNSVGMLLASLLGIEPLIGLVAGSITLSGGHGTGVAWGKVFSEEYGIHNATEIAMACATFGLILGGLIGGPVARFLLRTTLPSTAKEDKYITGTFEKPRAGRVLTSMVMIETLALIAICLLVGRLIFQLIEGTTYSLPMFVCVLFVGVILSNTLSFFKVYRILDHAVSIVGNVSLSLFLAMALMSLRLWELASLAMPMLFIIFIQAITMALYAIFVTYRVMGKNYDAAVIAAGHCGFGLGATPTAIANMQAITDKMGPSHIAFLIIPMVGAFFIDIVNAIIIKLYLLLPL